ncbi:MAG: hypothetical protein MUC47_07225 [Candidatus Kapabacteria bacterium]|jgi:hypothetical protein|nr:hypothetical protein [Candidatus Kapabacteria bacterium]
MIGRYICILTVFVLLAACGGMNGTLIEPSRGPKGLGELAINNNYDDDVVVKLYDVKQPTEPLHFIYVSGRSTAVVKEIAQGSLMMRYSKGKEWDNSVKMFKKERANYEVDQVFTFTETETEEQTSDGVMKTKHYSRQSFTFGVTGKGEGNVTTSPINDDEFQDK